MTRPGITSPIEGWFQRAKIREDAYVISYRKSVAAGETININLRNPDGTGSSVHVYRVLGGTQFKADATIYDDFSTDPNGGNGNSIDNLKLDSDNTQDTGEAIARYDVDFTANDPHFQTVVDSGGAGGTQIGGAIDGTEPIIEPGREIVIEAENTSTEAGDAGLGIVYFEE